MMEWLILVKTALIYSVVTIYLGRLRRPRIKARKYVQIFDRETKTNQFKFITC